MVRIIIFSILLAINIISTKAQSVDVPQTQVPLIIKVTATWCPTCGGWGWDFFEHLYEDNSEKAVIFANHYSGNYQNNTAQSIASNFNSVGQPVFFLDGKDENVTSSNQNSKRDYFSNQVNEIIQESPDVQTGIDATYSDNKLKIKYSIKFFNSLSGEYYLGLYPIEKSVIGYQASRGQNADHRNVLREELTSTPFGNLITSGDISSNSIFDGNLEVDLNSYDPENLEIACIIWKKEGTKYKFVNSNIDKMVEKYVLNNIDNNIPEEQNIIVFPSIINRDKKISVISNNVYENINIELFTTNGKKLRVLHINNLNKGINHLDLNSTVIKSGNYFLKITSDNKLLKSSKLIFQE